MMSFFVVNLIVVKFINKITPILKKTKRGWFQFLKVS